MLSLILILEHGELIRDRKEEENDGADFVWKKSKNLIYKIKVSKGMQGDMNVIIALNVQKKIGYLFERIGKVMKSYKRKVYVQLATTKIWEKDWSKFH